MSRKSYIIKRLVEIPFVLLIIISVIFLLIKIAPGDPVRMYVSDAYAPPEYVEQMRHKLGLDKPIHEQYVKYLRKLITGDFGFSFLKNVSVFDLIMSRLFNTLLLTGTAFIFAIIFGVSLGIIASKKPYSIIDNIISFTSTIIYSMPQFWIATIFLLILGLRFKLFPPGGIMSIGKEIPYWQDLLWHLCLPALVLGLSNAVAFFRLTRASMLEQIGSDYILTAWSKGCSERTVFYKHALRNALLPIVTWIGMRIPWLLYGAVLIETVFTWPGAGLLIYDAIFTRDYNVIMCTFIIISSFVLITNLITDILYSIVDPRITY